VNSTRILSWGILWSTIILTHGLRTSSAQDRPFSPLVSPDWLASQIDANANLRILDLPFRKTNYQTGHVPGAAYLDWRQDIISSGNRSLYQLPSKADMEQLLSRLGITPDTTIVATDNLQNRCAVRMYYTLKYFGHHDVRILDGGTNAWVAAGQKLSTQVPSFAPTNYRIRKVNNDYVAKLEAVQNAIDDADCQLIDGRPEDQFTGSKPGKAIHTNQPHKRLGHVPSAACIPWSMNLNEDGTFKTIRELKELYAAHGIETDGQVITYCNEGLHAVMPWFVIRELFGNSQVTVYDNSMAEWANRDDTPLEKSSDQ